MANLVVSSLPIKAGDGSTVTTKIYQDPNDSNRAGPVNAIVQNDGTIWNGVVLQNASQLSAMRTSAPGSYPATGLLSDSVDLSAPGVLEIWATGNIKFTCLDGSVDTRTIGSGVSLPYQLPVIVTRIWSTGTDITAASIKILKV